MLPRRGAGGPGLAWRQLGLCRGAELRAGAVGGAARPPRHVMVADAMAPPTRIAQRSTALSPQVCAGPFIGPVPCQGVLSCSRPLLALDAPTPKVGHSFLLVSLTTRPPPPAVLLPPSKESPRSSIPFHSGPNKPAQPFSPQGTIASLTRARASTTSKRTCRHQNGKHQTLCIGWSGQCVTHSTRSKVHAVDRRGCTGDVKVTQSVHALHVWHTHARDPSALGEISRGKQSLKGKG